MKPPAWLTWLSGPGARGAVLRVAAIGAWTSTTVREKQDVAKVTSKAGLINPDEMFLVDAFDLPDAELPVLAARIAELQAEGATGIVAAKPTPGSAIATREGESTAQVFRITKDNKVAFIAGPGPELPWVLILPTVDDLPENVWLMGLRFARTEAVAIGPAPALVLVSGQCSDAAAIEADVAELRRRWPAAVVVGVPR